MHFVMSAFSNHAVVLHNVTPFVQLQQTVVLSDGAVAPYLHSDQLAACSGRTLTQATKYKGGPFPSCGGVAGLCIL